MQRAEGKSDPRLAPRLASVACPLTAEDGELVKNGLRGPHQQGLFIIGSGTGLKNVSLSQSLLDKDLQPVYSRGLQIKLPASGLCPFHLTSSDVGICP